ncbi:MAG: 23S rRNA (adenine(1618)-N(6))-methyltransferase RlmF [Burkholderiaceae bacterium]
MLHPRNRHQGRYDFDLLIKDSPELSKFVIGNPHGDRSINFSNPAAVKFLNHALLKAFYGVDHWDIPNNYLCPPIPGRADYIHYLADLLAESNGGAAPRGPTVRALDIGAGASIIYPLIGYAEYGWRFLGSEIDPIAMASAQAIIQSNGFAKDIELRRQKSRNHIFKDLLKKDDRFDVMLCNPPFHSSEEEARNGSERKWRGLGRSPSRHKPPVLNFGGQNNELWCEGGEALFVRRIIKESENVRGQVLWFSSIVSKETHLPGILHDLKKAAALDVRIVEMAQGQKKSRFVAWTFLDALARRNWRSSAAIGNTDIVAHRSGQDGSVRVGTLGQSR